MERYLNVLNAECTRLSRTGRERQSCLVVHGSYAAELLTPVSSADGSVASLKSLELRKKGVSVPAKDVGIIATGSTCVYGLVDFLGPSTEISKEELREASCMAQHRVSEQELAAYLGDLPRLHGIPIGNPRVFRTEVMLKVKRGVQQFRSLDADEIQLLKNAPLATAEEAVAIMHALKKQASIWKMAMCRPKKAAALLTGAEGPTKRRRTAT
jgi:hypothetical protein